MHKDRFHYLLKCYKRNGLSAWDWKDWQDIVQDGQYQALIISDIECRMKQLLSCDFETVTVPEKSWEIIQTAIHSL